MMKKILGHAVLTVILILALVPQARSQVMNFLTVANLQSRSWNFTQPQQFSGGVTAPLNLTGTNGMTLPIFTAKAFGLAQNNFEVNASDSDGIAFTSSDAKLRLFRLASGHKAIGIGVKNAAGDGAVVAASNNNGAVKHGFLKFDFNLPGLSYSFDKTHRTDGTDLTSTLTTALSVDGSGTNAVTTITSIMALTCLNSAPASCSQGQFWRMCNGAVCHCVTANNPENIGSAGVCQ